MVEGVVVGRESLEGRARGTSHRGRNCRWAAQMISKGEPVIKFVHLGGWAGRPAGHGRSASGTARRAPGPRGWRRVVRMVEQPVHARGDVAEDLGGGAVARR